MYQDRTAYEYWGHEASILPIFHLPLGLRRMCRFPPESWRNAAWWKAYEVSIASKRRVLRRLRSEGPLESVDFERQAKEPAGQLLGGAMPIPKEDKRTLQLFWHSGRVAVADRVHFRRVYDLAERVYPEVAPASPAAFEDSWLLIALAGNGVASERHLVNYFTAPRLKAAERKRVIRRNLKKGRIVEVRLEGVRGVCYALPEHLDGLPAVPEPEGTTLISPSTRCSGSSYAPRSCSASSTGSRSTCRRRSVSTATT